MLSFAYPWILLLLPVAWLARRLLPPGERPELALAVPLLCSNGADPPLSVGRGRRLARACLWLFWLCLLMRDLLSSRVVDGFEKPRITLCRT